MKTPLLILVCAVSFAPASLVTAKQCPAIGAVSYPECFNSHRRISFVVRLMLAGKDGEEAASLRKACRLNLSSCYLNIGRYKACVDNCSAVLKDDRHNSKALYRRGQAHMAEGSYQEAVKVAAWNSTCQLQASQCIDSIAVIMEATKGILQHC